MKWKTILLMGLWMVLMMVSVNAQANPSDADFTKLHNKAVLKMHFHNATLDNSTNKLSGRLSKAQGDTGYFNPFTIACLNRSVGCVHQNANTTKIVILLNGTANGLVNQTTGLNNITISFYANFTATSSSAVIVDGTLDNMRLRIDVDGTDRINVRMVGNNSVYNMYGANFPNLPKVAFDSWVHYLFILNMTEGAIHAYINGTYYATSSTIEGAVSGAGGNNLLITNPSPVVQALYIFNGTLNQSEILYLNKSVILVDPSPLAWINTPSVDSKSHNATPRINITLNTALPHNYSFQIFLNRNSSPATLIRTENNVSGGDFLTINYTLIDEVDGSINGTYYIKINGSTNATLNFSVVQKFEITNDINQYHTTNVTIISPLNTSGDNARCYFNLTNKANVLNDNPNQSDNISIRDVHWLINGTQVSSANNNTVLNAPNITAFANISCRVRINNGFGETAWTPYNSSLNITVNDTTNPIIKINWTSISITDGTEVDILINVTDNFQLNETNISVRNPNGVYFNRSCINIKSDNYLCNITFFDGDETSVVGIWNLTIASAMDTSGNLITTYPNQTLTVNAVVTTSSGGGGGGGGGAVVITVTNTTNVTLVENCNFNKICQGNLGEDVLGCPSDCKFNIDYLTCDDPTQNCITDTVRRLFTARSRVLNISILIGLVALAIVFIPENSPIGRYIKKPLLRK